MKKVWHIFKVTLLTLCFTLIAVPVSLYIILSTQWAQSDIRQVAVSELSALLGTDVSLGHIEIHPFKELSIHNISARDDFGQPALSIKEITVAFDFFHLLRTGRLVVDFALIDAPEVSLYKASKDAPLNIADILGALKSDKPSRQSNYDLKVNTVIIRDGKMHFDILDAPVRDSVFDINHLYFKDVMLNAYIPRISNDEYRVEIERFSFNESNGLSLTDLNAAAQITSTASELENLTLVFPRSSISFRPFTLDYNGFKGLYDKFKTEGIDIGIMPGSIIYPPDFSVFAHQLGCLTDSIEIILNGKVSPERLSIDRLTLSQTDENFAGTISVYIDSIPGGVESYYRLNDLRFSANKTGINSLLSLLPQKTRDAVAGQLVSLRPNDNLSFSATAAGRLRDSDIRARLALGDNAMTLTGHYSTPDTFKTLTIKSNAGINFDDLSFIHSHNTPTAFHGVLSSNVKIAGKTHNITARLDSAAFAFKGNHYAGLSLSVDADPSHLSAEINSTDPNIQFSGNCSFDMTHGHKTVDAALHIDHFKPHALGLTDKFPDYSLSASAYADFDFDNIDDLTGKLAILDISFADDDPSTSDLKLAYLNLETFPNTDSPGLLLTSDIINAYINGNYRLSTLPRDFNEIAASVFPALYSERFEPAPETERDNNFVYNIKVGACEQLCKFLNLPMGVIYPIDINGHFSSQHRAASLSVTAPYLLQGDKIIENTSLTADIDADSNSSNLRFNIKMPTKKGPLSMTAVLNGRNNRMDSNIDWIIERKIPINGAFNFSTLFSRDLTNQLSTTIAFKPGTITFGNDVWAVNPSWISIEPKRYSINNFALASGHKSIDINGIVSDNDDDTIDIVLTDIAMLDIFETLEIDKALIGGTASGTFKGQALLTGNPELYCDNLHVDSISYNRCVLGNADVVAFWDSEKQAFNLNAEVEGFHGNMSHISGDIYPAGEALDINFNVDHAPVGFMKPFMSAFASDLEGYASGKARLFGTFKYIDMEGDVFAEDLKIKIDFTNTWYSATDSIHLEPGSIDIKDIIIYDENGHTATLNGVVRHKFFKEPSFNFSVTDARDFLSYNVDSRLSPDWYGTIYGNGRATISGEPGVVNIGVNMTTAPKSVFNFVLSDRLDADEYSFITFTDRRAKALHDSIMAADNIPTVVRQLRERLGADNNDSPSAYNMDLQMTITPDARMVLVMDPVGGDEIKANGSGNLRLTYESVNNDLKMYGTYTLNHGNYNFTLQDIIIKDFTIKEGSTIAFHGDPYSAQLNIQASYGVNANLSDLDESFLLDKDLNRTNVPVHALLKVTGDMRQPDIDFDLEFPTLTQDTYRKVRSIVSTKEMMNRQIIYLLALNRFYTPDYMASTTKGNELFSVASSTISSQLSSMLGKLSDDWSIAPNLRSDRGDFSDVEVDVALSSRLLNNRLLFNGNFGYRDKTLNTNQFIGDFDIEYLLNPKGSWRLKAYNRYNDQNYYVRTAQTTQGVGLVFKKDFDNFFGFLRPKKKIGLELEFKSVEPDSTKIVLPDSIAHPVDPLTE